MFPFSLKNRDAFGILWPWMVGTAGALAGEAAISSAPEAAWPHLGLEKASTKSVVLTKPEAASTIA